MRPSYLIIGALTRDVTPEGFRYGGSVLYAGLTAQALGYELKIVTTCSREEPLERLFPGVQIFLQASAETTTFVNLESPQGRKQQILTLATPINIGDLPQDFRQADIVHLAPVADECPLGAEKIFSSQFLGASIQGWLRGWDKKGLVFRKKAPEEAFSSFSALVMSREDIDGELDYAKSLAQKGPLVVVTQDKDGALLWQENQWLHLPAPRVSVVDPCGAGDIFSAVFFSALFEGLETKQAVALANCLAARSVSRQAMESIPLAKEIKDCYHQIGQEDFILI
ncbi:PfkB family carbohydrate kinase [Thermosulfuriphilus sp.]